MLQYLELAVQLLLAATVQVLAAAAVVEPVALVMIAQ
jgi:hypothetical protein